MVFVDSVDKVVGTYFAAVTTEPFSYKDVEFTPKPLRVSPGLLRGYTCPPGCGGCCFRFSLDYLPEEDHSYDLRSRIVSFNGYGVLLLSDLQEDHDDHFCRNLSRSDGRCNIHGKQPFSCDFELIRFSFTTGPDRPNQLTQKLYGRGWSFLRVDGERGALCTMQQVDPDSIADTVRRLKRLKVWADYFGLETCLDELISWAESGPHSTPIVLNSSVSGKAQDLLVGFGS